MGKKKGKKKNKKRQERSALVYLIPLALLLLLLILPLYIYIYSDIVRSKKTFFDANTSSSIDRSCCFNPSSFCGCDINKSEENETIVESPDDPCKLITKPTKEELKMAKIAWKYIENNYNEETGLINAADNYPSASVWDWANGLYAIYTAKKFGLITQDRFEEMVNRFLETMQDMKLFNNELPNKTYNTASAKMTDYNNVEQPDGIGWSVADLARLLAALNLLQQCEDTLNPTIEKLLLRYRYCRSMSVVGNMYGAEYENGETKLNHEALTGYEEYLARSYEIWGFNLSEARSYKFMKEVNIFGVNVPTETRDFYSAFLGSESYWYTGFDYGVDDNESGKYIQSIYEVQEARYRATSQFTAVTEDHIDQAPYFLYNTIYENLEPWKIINHHAQDYNEFKSVSTKAAIGMKILFDTNYTSKLFDFINNNYHKDKGYYAGIYETMPGANEALTLNTNAVILESLLFKNMGPLQKLNTIHERGTYDYYRNKVNSFRCLPNEESKRILEPYSIDMEYNRSSKRDIDDAKIAWVFFENNYNPDTGIVNAYHNYNIIQVDAIGKTIMGTLAARSLDIIDQKTFDTRINRLVATLKTLPLYNNELPNTYYNATTGKMTKEFGEESEVGVGWKIYSMAHFMTGLFHLQNQYPKYSQDICDIVSRFDFNRSTTKGMFDAQIDVYEGNATEHLYQVADPSIEHYIHTALKLFNIDTYSHFIDERHLDYRRIYDYEVPAGAIHKVTNAETYLWSLMEHPYYLKYKHYSSNIFLAQKHRYHITNKVTTSSHEHLDQEPYFVANDLYNDRRHWSDFNRYNQPLQDFSTYSTKAAFVYDALYGHIDEYARVLKSSVSKLYNEKEGWFGGFYHDFERPNKSLNILTNSAVLESIYYKQIGNFYYHKSALARDRIAMQKPIFYANKYSIASPTIKLFAYTQKLLKRFEDKDLVRIERDGENYVLKVGAFDTQNEAKVYLEGLDTNMSVALFDRRFLNEADDREFKVIKNTIDSKKFLWANRYYRYDYRIPYENRLIEDANLSFVLPCDTNISKKKIPLLPLSIEEDNTTQEHNATQMDLNTTLEDNSSDNTTPKTLSIVDHISLDDKNTTVAPAQKVDALKLALLENSNNRYSNRSIEHSLKKRYDILEKKSNGERVEALKEQSKKSLFKAFKDWFDLSITFDTSLKNLSTHNATRETLNLNLNISPMPYLYFATTLMLDTNGFKDIYYQPDFYYSFGYASYQLDSWGFSYSNYENNKFKSDQHASSFSDGTWEINYRTKIKEFFLTAKAKYRPSKNWKFLSLSGYRQLSDKTSFSFDYDKSFHYDQHKLQLSMKSFIYDKFFVAGSIFLYSDLALQEDHESDYSFSFGWADNRQGKFSIIYSNEYMKTRWPWRDDAKGISPLEGKISISYHF
jgi:hypothetical protein